MGTPGPLSVLGLQELEGKSGASPATRCPHCTARQNSSFCWFGFWSSSDNRGHDLTVSQAFSYRELPTCSFQRPLVADILIPVLRRSWTARTLEWGAGICQVIPFVSVCPRRWDRGVPSDVPISRVSEWSRREGSSFGARELQGMFYFPTSLLSF